MSGRQVAEPGYVAEVAQVVAASGIEPSRLVLEFTEGVLMKDTEATLATMADGPDETELRSLGADLGQGFLFAKPLEPDDVSALLSAESGQLDEPRLRRGVA